MIKLDVPTLLDTAKKMKDSADRIETSINKIDNIVSDMDTVWNDANAKMYLAKYGELKESFPAFKNAAREYSAFLYKVVDIYKKEYLDPTSTSVNV